MAAYAQGQKECAINARIGVDEWLDEAGAGGGGEDQYKCFMANLLAAVFFGWRYLIMVG
jgi:hypothetical protein